MRLTIENNYLNNDKTSLEFVFDPFKNEGNILSDLIINGKKSNHIHVLNTEQLNNLVLFFEKYRETLIKTNGK